MLSIYTVPNFLKIAGVIGKFVEYPFDTIKVRLQSQPQNVPLQYNGPLDCFRQSWQRDGVKGLYRGISAPIVGAAIETSSLFFSVRTRALLITCTPMAHRVSVSCSPGHPPILVLQKRRSPSYTRTPLLRCCLWCRHFRPPHTH